MLDINKTLNDKTSLAVLASFLILSIFTFLLLIKHDLGNFNRLNRTMRETRDNIAMLENLEKYNAYIERFNEHFAERKGSDQLMELLTELSKNESITFSIIKPLGIESVAGYNIIKVEGEGDAPYTNIVELVKKIENDSAYIFVEKLDMSNAANRPGAFNNRPAYMPEPSGAQAPKSSEDTHTQPVSFKIIIAAIGG